MQMTELHRKRGTLAWVLLFYLLAGYKWWQGMWFYQADPYLLLPRFDGTTWLFMLTGWHHQVLAYKAWQYTLDGLFYALPGIYAWVYLMRPKLASRLAVVWLLINWVYVQLYCSLGINSIEAHIAWLLFPLLFMARSLQRYYLILHGLRYYFLYFFCSAGLWKLWLGGAWEPTTMSGILLEQHKEWLLTAPTDYWQRRLIIFLIEVPLLGFALYWMAILIELSFGAGFFTRRADATLFVLFILFLIFDYVVMRIPYFDVSPFLLTLWYSYLKAPAPLSKTPA